jgi:hypothetical protein
MINLSGYTLLEGIGLERREIIGQYDPEGLADLFIREWVHYYECHKCSRVDYCKFPQPVAEGSYRMKEIQCGVVVAALRNFVNSTFPLLDELSHEQIQAYLDGAFYLARFLFDTEVRIGSSMDTAYIQSLGDWQAPFFGRFVHLRNHLNDMGAAFSQIPDLLANKGVLLVEGQSEAAFIERLRLSYMGWFIHLDVDTYEGKGSRGPKRLEMLLRHLQSQGYEVYIEGDADSGATNIFDPHIARELVGKENTFVFQANFESSVPDHLTYKALRLMGFLQDLTYSEFKVSISDCEWNTVQTIKDSYGINIDDAKIEFAESVADIISWDRDWTWWQDEDFLQSELGQFLEFLRSINF